MDKGKLLNCLYNMKLTMRATLVINYLINRSNKELTCFPAVKTIAKDCNISTRTVQRALKDLLDAGVIKKENRYRENGGQSSNLYTLVFDEENKEKESLEIKEEETEKIYEVEVNEELIMDTIDFNEYKSVGLEDIVNSEGKVDERKNHEYEENENLQEDIKNISVEFCDNQYNEKINTEKIKITWNRGKHSDEKSRELLAECNCQREYDNLVPP